MYVCTTEMADRQLNYYQSYQDNHQKMTSLYNKWSNTSSTSSYSTASSSFEVLFSRLLDALIFTSAIAITAYSYLTGTLAVEPAPRSSPPLTYLSPKQIRYEYQSSRYDDHKRRRTQEWAEQQLLTTPIVVKRRSCSTSSKVTMKREKKRTQSLPVNKLEPEEEDELLSRMEERLQSLIQQGQEALHSYHVEN